MIVVGHCLELPGDVDLSQDLLRHVVIIQKVVDLLYDHVGPCFIMFSKEDFSLRALSQALKYSVFFNHYLGRERLLGEKNILGGYLKSLGGQRRLASQASHCGRISFVELLLHF